MTNYRHRRMSPIEDRKIEAVMGNETDKLLSILNLPEETLDKNRCILQPQYSALYKYQEENNYFDLPHIDCTIGGTKTKMFLADLAFRLRDEEIEGLWINSLAFVMQARFKMNYRPLIQSCYSWAITTAKPIDWIIAALIAKESNG